MNIKSIIERLNLLRSEFPYLFWGSPIILCLLGVLIWSVASGNGETDIDGSVPEPTLGTIIQMAEIRVEIDYIDSRLDAIETNVTAVINAVNAMEPSEDNDSELTAGISDLQVQLNTLSKAVSQIRNIYGNYTESMDKKIDQVVIDIEELEEEFASHSDNTTIHWDIEEVDE